MEVGEGCAAAGELDGDGDAVAVELLVGSDVTRLLWLAVGEDVLAVEEGDAWPPQADSKAAPASTMTTQAGLKEVSMKLMT